MAPVAGPIKPPELADIEIPVIIPIEFGKLAVMF